MIRTDGIVQTDESVDVSTGWQSRISSKHDVWRINVDHTQRAVFEGYSALAP